jgi:hypothetical protein
MKSARCLAALLALGVAANLAQAANNADECKKEGGVWRESASMGGYCFKKLAGAREIAAPAAGDPDTGAAKANHNSVRSNKATVAPPPGKPGPKPSADLADKVN